MGKHKVWRKLAKKFRRKKIRQLRAKERCKKEEEEQRRLEQSPTYIKQRDEINLLEALQEEEEKRQAEIEHKKWLQGEEEAQKQWLELQERLDRARSQKERQEQIIREEWEREQKLIMERKREQKELVDAQMKKAEEMEKQIKDFIEDGGELPESLNVSFETNPDKEICPFFKKTGACRFRDTCSRNHVKPGASRILLLPGFYSHFGIEQSNQNEYDVDISLEYDDDDTYAHFTEFFNDVYPEFRKYGEIECFRVCRNFEPHLRGNVYVEFDSLQSSLKAYRIFHGRWYGGKQIRVEFVNVPSWTSAICGLFFKNKCPKGRSCNFLHVFKNPGEKFQRNKQVTLSQLSHCRWSESPELEIYKRSSHDKNRSCKRSKRNSYDNEYDKSDDESNVRNYRNRSQSSRSSRNDYRHRTESSRSKKYDERNWSDVEDYSDDHNYNEPSRSQRKYDESSKKKINEEDYHRDDHRSESSRSRQYDEYHKNVTDDDYSRNHRRHDELYKSRKKYQEHKSKKRKRKSSRDK